jgi:hypothetical protein
MFFLYESDYIKFCLVDGGYTEWSQFGDCSATCGDGFKTKTRTCTNPVPSGGGKQCVGESSETSECNVGVCIGIYFSND